jgi:hypothetical protein
MIPVVFWITPNFSIIATAGTPYYFEVTRLALSYIILRDVIVVGTPRSGRSLTASIFVKKAYCVAGDPASQLIKASDTNLGGCWRLDDLIKANAWISRTVGFERHNTWRSDEIRSRQAEAIFSLEYLEDH